MGCRLISILMILSLLLSAGMAGLWARSYYRFDEVSVVRPEGGWRVKSAAGTLHFGNASRLMYGEGVRWSVSPMPQRTTSWKWVYPNMRVRWSCGGFAAISGSYDRGPAWVPYRVTVVPWWPWPMLVALGPAAWLAQRVLRRHRGKAGCCPECGYDLRASTGRCPECGRRIVGGGVG